jgi:hypothetical protein
VSAAPIEHGDPRVLGIVRTVDVDRDDVVRIDPEVLQLFG